MSRPSNNPVKINEDTWYYENAKSLKFVHWIRDKNGRRIKAGVFLVPWSKIKGSYPARTIGADSNE
jgi:hypothetical protein